MTIDSPIPTIEERLDEIRALIFGEAKKAAMKQRWLKKREFDEAQDQFLKETSQSGLNGDCKQIARKVKKKAFDDFGDIFVDNWMLESICSINIDKEFKKAFEKAWGSIGPRPSWVKDPKAL
jgi:hypothetical protein